MCIFLIEKHSGQFWEFPRIEPRVPPHQEYHKLRSRSSHQVSYSTPRRETLGLTRTSHSVRGERDLGPRPEFTSNPKERTLSLVPGAHPTLREKLQDQASPWSSQRGSSMRIHTFTRSSSEPGYPIFQVTLLFQWRQLQMAADIPVCQS